MYKNLYIPIDNSPLSNFGLDIGIDIAKRLGSSCVGSHVYAGALHDSRFKQMEGGLPDKYKKEEELLKQRDVHNSLIDKGLRIISDSFLDIFEKRCNDEKIPYIRKCLEGKNYHILANDINSTTPDLVIIGALGLGAVKDSQIGSVCERVVRRVGTDVLVVKNTAPIAPGNKILVALDGSSQSFAGLYSAISISKVFDLKVEVVSVFDPYFHYVAFNNIVKVLSKEAAELFKFSEQERLHEEIIDSGLAKIYKNNLLIANKIAEKEGIQIKTTLLSGKPFEQILKYIKENNPWLTVMGKLGIHSETGMDIGSNTENILRLAPCNILITNGKCTIDQSVIQKITESNVAWTEEASARLSNIPEFARGMAKMSIQNFAVKSGYSIITSDVIDKVMQNMPAGFKKI